MRESLVTRLRCPACRVEGRFEVESNERDGRELRSGSVTCRSCGYRGRVERGVVDLLHDPPESVRREAAGLERFADAMRADGWDRERILRLPDEDQAYWRGQARQFERLLARIPVEPGQTLLDVGSNTCWASNAFAERGLDVIALDIATAEMQGLHTADWWMDANDVYFERVRSTMAEPAIASGCLDWVFCCETLHHNSPADLGRTLHELHRVLRPGGALLVINEPLRYPTNLKRDHGAEVAQFEGNENVYFFHQYVRAARGAGFEVELLEPPAPVFTGDPLWLVEGASVAGSTKLYAQQLLRRTRPGRRTLFWWSMLLGPDGNMSMICRKPVA